MTAMPPRILFLAPSGSEVGLTTVALGLVRALDARGVRVGFCKPIGQRITRDDGPERSTFFIRSTTTLHPADPIYPTEAAHLISSGQTEQLLEKVISIFHDSRADADVMVVEGIVHTPEWPTAAAINKKLARALSANVILVGAMHDNTPERLDTLLEMSVREFGGTASGNVLGCIINRVPESFGNRLEGIRESLPLSCPFLERSKFPIIGAIPDNPDLAAPRTIDLARHLSANIIHPGDIETRRVKNFTLLARTVPNMIGAFKPGSLLITPADRADVVIAASMAALNKVTMAGLLLTGETQLPPGILDLCRPGLDTGLPVLAVETNSWQTATDVSHMSSEVPIDDNERVNKSMDYVAQRIDADWLAEKTSAPVEARMSPAAFCHRLVTLARESPKRIVLPEGTEPRTIRAAALCARRSIARCVLLGDPVAIRKVAAGQEVEIPDGVEIIDPAVVRARYVKPLFEMRKHKGVSEQEAADMLEDNVWLGTVMLALGEVDGLVSGAIHSSANTIRPALQIIKTKPGAKVVSSVFFMCLPDQVLVYGDCAVNPDPNAEMLADIAIQSAASAETFGLQARVAMISYSTGESGSGSDVEKVREATRIAREKRPDILLDGPLQYDAAANAGVAAQKAPDSRIAGRATVFIFPDLNTGNTTYKAVQRSANVLSIGPILQGMRRPVNDLSRGCLVEDIVYTIAVTAVQARAGAEGE
jgi:phosphate acetyltransferase